MSWIQKTEDGGTEVVVKESEFHRVNVGPNDQLRVRALEKPVAIWIPSGYMVTVTAERGMVIDVAEVVEHHDVVSMEGKLREMRNDKRKAENAARRAKRRSRRLERPEREPKEERGG